MIQFHAHRSLGRGGRDGPRRSRRPDRAARPHRRILRDRKRRRDRRRLPLEPYVYIKRWTTLGERNEISAGTVLGTDPFDKNFTGERSYLRIGHDNIIREHYTISRGTAPESATEIGDGNYIMTSGHIAHNCKIGNRTVIASCALLAGYVEIEDQAFVSGGVGIHQFSKIGRLAMIGGNTRVNSDVPPFFLYSGFRVEAKGLNVVGLKRAGYQASDLALLKKAYHFLYRAGLEVGGGPGADRKRDSHSGDAPPGGIRAPQRAGHLPGVARWPASRAMQGGAPAHRSDPAASFGSSRLQERGG